MGADNELTAKLRFLSGVLRTEGAINASDDVLRAVAEIDRQRVEVDACISPDWVIGYFPADVAEEVKRAVRDAFGEWNALSPKPAPAMPNGVEDIDWPFTYIVPNSKHEYVPKHHAERKIREALRAADNRDAAGVLPAWIATWMADREILPDDDGDGISEGALVEALNNHERELLNAIPKAPAAAPAGEAVAYSVVQVGNRGAAYDQPNTHRAFTYEHQPGNIDASRLGRATAAAAVASAGDSIDRGLSLLKELQAIGFGVFQIGPPAPVQAAPQEVAQHPCIKCGNLVYAWKKDAACTVCLECTSAPEVVRKPCPVGCDGKCKARAHGCASECPILPAQPAAHHSACELGADDVGEIFARDKRVWALAGLAEKCGAVKDEGESGLFWTLTLGDFYKLEAALQHRGDSRGGEAGHG